MTLTVDRIDHIVLNVEDVEESAAWYGRVLGMRRTDHDSRIAMWFGEHKLHLRPADVSQEEWFTSRVAAPGSDDLCFSASASLAEIQRHLQTCGIDVETGPVERDGARGRMMSVYCRDPDGNLVEVSTYQA